MEGIYQGNRPLLIKEKTILITGNTFPTMKEFLSSLSLAKESASFSILLEYGEKTHLMIHQPSSLVPLQ